MVNYKRKTNRNNANHDQLLKAAEDVSKIVFLNSSQRVQGRSNKVKKTCKAVATKWCTSRNWF